MVDVLQQFHQLPEDLQDVSNPLRIRADQLMLRRVLYVEGQFGIRSQDGLGEGRDQCAVRLELVYHVGS
jgi:hypothetical protein